MNTVSSTDNLKMGMLGASSCLRSCTNVSSKYGGTRVRDIEFGFIHS